MKDSCWLIFDKKGVREMRKGRRSNWQNVERPALKAGQYAVLVTVNCPDRAFQAVPLPEATITVPEGALIAPVVDVKVEVPGE